MKPGLHDGTDVGCGDAPFLAKAHDARNPRAGALLLVAGPTLGEIQLQRGQPRQSLRDQRSGDRDLAIGDLAQRTAVLPLRADRRGSLLRESRVVDRQHAAPRRNHLAQPPPERANLPGRMGNEVLQALIGPRIAQPTVHRLHRLPVAVAEKPLQVPTGVGPVCSPTEARRELIEKLPEPHQHRARPGVRHASEGTESAVFVQVKLTK